MSLHTTYLDVSGCPYLIREVSLDADYLTAAPFMATPHDSSTLTCVAVTPHWKTVDRNSLSFPINLPHVTCHMYCMNMTHLEWKDSTLPLYTSLQASSRYLSGIIVISCPEPISLL